MGPGPHGLSRPPRPLTPRVDRRRNWVALTGSSDGLPGIGRPRVGIGSAVLDLSDKRHMYWLVLAFVILGYALARRVVESPFGRALVAVRESEERARAIDIDVTRHGRVALVFSGALGGLGTLYGSLVRAVIAIGLR